MKAKILNQSKYPNPKYADIGAAGLDLNADINDSITFKPFERKLIPTGLIIQLPPGTEGQVRPRSGMVLKKGLTVANAPGTIDETYRGTVGVILYNISNQEVTIDPGERIAQLVVAKYERIEFENVNSVEEMDKTERGEGGFGSTGTK